MKPSEVTKNTECGNTSAQAFALESIAAKSRWTSKISQAAESNPRMNNFQSTAESPSCLHLLQPHSNDPTREPCLVERCLWRYTGPDGLGTKGENFTFNEINALARKILREDNRFHSDSYVDGHDPLGEELVNIRQKDIAPVSPGRMEQLEKRLLGRMTADLVSFMRRPDEHLLLPGPPGAEAVCTQHLGQIVFDEESKAFRIVNGISQSSESIKRDREPGNEHIFGHNANLASVTTPGKLLIGRSGRSDTIERIEELLLFNALESLRVNQGRFETATGFHACEDGSFEFQMALMSAMEKMKPITIKADLIADESMYLKGIDRSINDLFANREIIERNAALSPGSDPVTIRIRRPYRLSLMLSTGSMSRKNIRKSRKFNIPIFETLYRELSDKWAGSSDPARQQVGSEMSKAGDLDQMKQKLSSLRSQYENLELKAKMALDALHLTLCGSDFKGNHLLGYSDSGKEFLIIGHLLDEVNVALSVQCKSGQDRTLIMVALKVACDMFERGHDSRSFYPQDPPAEDLAYFKRAFTEAANRFGSSMIRLVRGLSKEVQVKWNDKVVPQDYYLPDLYPDCRVWGGGKALKKTEGHP